VLECLYLKSFYVLVLYYTSGVPYGAPLYGRLA
jgi:hypothetical protein